MVLWHIENNAEKGRRGDTGLIDDRVIVEVKATENLLKVHPAQVLTYLRLSQRKLGLVLNFGQSLLRDGISRVVNNF